MERIKEAIQRAKSSAKPDDNVLEPAGVPYIAQKTTARVDAPTSRLVQLAEYKPDAAHLENHRVVTYEKNNPNHIKFDMLRTRIMEVMKREGWTTLAVTSPMPGCGKTVTVANLAFSFARQKENRVVGVDFDLRSPALSNTLGYANPGSLSAFYNGTDKPDDIFVTCDDNLFFGLNKGHVANSTEWIAQDQTEDLIRWIRDKLHPTVIIFDLPPMLTADDAQAFLPKVDCVLLVAAAGSTTAREIENCERQLVDTHYLGIVLNKCTGIEKIYSPYY